MKPVTLAPAIPAPAPAAPGAGSAGADGFAELIQALLTGPAKGAAPAPAAGPGPEPKKEDAPEATADQAVLPAIPAQFAALAQTIPAPALPDEHDSARDAADGPILPQPAVAAAPSAVAPLPAGAAPAAPGPVAAAAPAAEATSPVKNAPAPDGAPTAPAPGNPAETITYAAAAAAPAAPAAPQRGNGAVAAEDRATPARDAEQREAPDPVPATITSAMLPAAPKAAPAVSSAAPAPVAAVAVEVQTVRSGLRAPEPAVVQASAPADTAPESPSIQAPVVPQAVPAPTAITAPAAASVPSAPAPVRVPSDYTAQLARPLVTIAAAGRGEHTMTVKVTPENLGPVTVQAHISGGAVRIEMFAATADGRDVLRQALPDLKRDLAGAGVTASLDLSSNSQSGSPQGGQDRENFTRRYPSANQAPANGRPLEMKDQPARATPGLYGPDSRLDVMA